MECWAIYPRTTVLRRMGVPAHFASYRLVVICWGRGKGNKSNGYAL